MRTLLALISLAFFSAASAQPAWQTMSPNSAADCTSLGGPGPNWSNSGNAASSNNQLASATVDGTVTDPLRCLDYRFTIPSNASILGIEVRVERNSSRTQNGGSNDNSLFLVKAGSAVGANRATSTDYTTSDVIEGHGSPTDLWGTTWTPAEINAADFGTVYTGTKPDATGQAHTISVDHIEITVHYSIPAVVTPGSFNAFETTTAAAAIAGVIRTRVAGSTFSLDVVAIAAGVQQNAFTGQQVTVELLGNNTLGVALDANNCPTSSTTLQAVAPNPTITTGRSTVNFAAVANSWRDVRVRVRWPTASPTVTACSSDNFAIRPNQFTSFSVTDADAETAGMTRPLDNLAAPGGVVHKAGRPFTVRATAVNAAGTPATTTNYTGAPGGVLSDCGASNACLASGFGTFALGTSFAAGQLTSNVATYSEVGSVALGLVDADFASVDAADGSSANEREIRSATLNVGRFVPDHFAVSLNTPSLGTGCAAGSFTYVGESFSYTTPPVITVTAQNFSNGTTLNYSGVLWQITNTSLTGKSYSAASGTLDTSGLAGTDPVVAATGSGVGTLTFGSGTGLFFTRTTPVAPFDAEVSLAINVIDADGVAYESNPARFGQASAGNGIAFSSGKSMRFGRLAVRNANGSQLVPLALQVEAQYAAYTNPPTNTVLGFITNTADSCTSMANANLAMSSFTSNLSACETAVSGAGALSAGRRTVLLAAPGNGNDGTVLLTMNLGAAGSGTTCTTVGGGTVSATGANRSFLQGNWTGANYDQNPSARASFGTFRGADEVIFVRENF